MADHTIYITAVDAEKLHSLIREAQRTDYRGSTYLQALSAELARAITTDPRNVPPDVITMNSKAVLVDEETGEEMEYTLVFPEEADPIEGKVSVLAPIGTAMLGYRVGDTFEWETPSGKVRMRVKELLYQPEASGNCQ